MKANLTTFVFLLYVAVLTNAHHRFRRQDTSVDHALDSNEHATPSETTSHNQVPREEENKNAESAYKKRIPVTRHVVHSNGSVDLIETTEEEHDLKSDMRKIAVTRHIVHTNGSIDLIGTSEENYDLNSDEFGLNEIHRKRVKRNITGFKLSRIGSIIAKVQPIVKFKKLLKKYNGNIVATFDKESNQVPAVHVSGTEQFWKSEDGNNIIRGEGHYDKKYNSKGELEDSYGGKLSLSGSLLNTEDGTGSVEIELNRVSDQGTQFSLDANQGLWKSADEKNELRGKAYYHKQFGPGPNEFDNAGGQLVYEGSPSVSFAKFENPVMARARWHYDPNKGSNVYVEGNGLSTSNDNSTSLKVKGSYKQNFGTLEGQKYDTQLDFNKNDFRLGLGVKKDLYEAPQIHLDLNHKLWKSPDNGGVLEASAYYDKNFENMNDQSNQKYGFGLSLNHFTN